MLRICLLDHDSSIFLDNMLNELLSLIEIAVKYEPQIKASGSIKINCKVLIIKFLKKKTEIEKKK